jgi:hypothetical protein
MGTDRERASGRLLLAPTCVNKKISSKRFQMANGRVHEGRAVRSMASRSADVTKSVCFVETNKTNALSCSPAVLQCCAEYKRTVAEWVGTGEEAQGKHKQKKNQEQRNEERKGKKKKREKENA